MVFSPQKPPFFTETGCALRKPRRIRSKRVALNSLLPTEGFWVMIAPITAGGSFVGGSRS